MLRGYARKQVFTCCSRSAVTKRGPRQERMSDLPWPLSVDTLVHDTCLLRLAAYFSPSVSLSISRHPSLSSVSDARLRGGGRNVSGRRSATPGEVIEEMRAERRAFAFDWSESNGDKSDRLYLRDCEVSPHSETGAPRMVSDGAKCDSMLTLTISYVVLTCRNS